MLPQVANLKTDLLATPGGIGTGDTSFALVSGIPFGAPSYKIVIRIGDEDIRCLVSGTSVTQAERGFGGTTAASHTAASTVTMVLPAEYINDLMYGLETGWVRIPSYVAVGNATTAITLSGDWTSTVSKGDKIQFQNGSQKYGYVSATPTFASSVTTIPYTGGVDYPLAVGAVTSVMYSKAATPSGFPIWISYAPTYGGVGGLTITGSITTISAQFKVDGLWVTTRNQATYTMAGTASGGVNVNVPFTLPGSGLKGNGYGIVTDTSASPNVSAEVEVSADTQKISIAKFNQQNFTLGSGGFAITSQYQF